MWSLCHTYGYESALNFVRAQELKTVARPYYSFYKGILIY